MEHIKQFSLVDNIHLIETSGGYAVVGQLPPEIADVNVGYDSVLGSTMSSDVEKLCFVVESLAEHNLDLLCITETWLLPSDVTVIIAALPSSYSFHHVPRSTDARGGGMGLICSRALSNVRVVPNHMDVSSFEFLEITFSFHLQNIRMAILYHPGHPGTDRAFMEEFGRFLEILSVCREKLVICGDFDYWPDNPSLKPYTNEFMSSRY